MTVEERVERLERQNRLLWLVIAVSIVFGLLTAMMLRGSGDYTPDVVKAKAFHVVNEDGRLLAHLSGGNNNSGELFILGEGETLLSAYAGSEVGMMLNVHNGVGTPIVSLAAGDKFGFGRVTLFNEEQNELVVISANDSGSGLVTTSNKKGRLVSVSSTVAGQGIVVTTNDEGEELVRLGVVESAGTVTTFNKGQLLVGLCVAEAGGVGMVITRNHKGQELVTLGANDDGEGAVAVLDPSGRRRRGVLMPE